MMNSDKSLFITSLEAKWKQGLFVCVGLDITFAKLPPHLRKLPSPQEAVYQFNKSIIDATHDLVCAYKPNAAYYEAMGAEGWQVLQDTIHYIKDAYPDIPVILDAKRADIGETNEAYAQAAFDYLGADAITVHPYFGREALEPFLSRQDKGVIVMGANSNPGAKEFQDLQINESGLPLYQHIAKEVARRWNTHNNCAVTVGATQPHKIAEIRRVVDDMPLLILGVGTQGGEVESTVKAAQDSRGWGMIINSSRAVIYASQKEDFAQAARNTVIDLNQAISLARKS